MTLRIVLALAFMLSSLATNASHASARQDSALQSSALQESVPEISTRVEIVRTTYGIPHILADDLEAMGYALGWVQSEDYGDQVAIGMVRRRGTYARFVGRDSIGGDFTGRVAHALAAESFGLLDSGTQDVYRGFAEGVNQYVRLHAELFPDWLTPDFDGIDALANDVYTWSRGDAAAFVRAESRRAVGRESGRGPDVRPDLPRSWLAAERDEADFDPAVDGSNAWALDGSRTTSGHTILLRNPHLAWNAGYYEAHVRVPGVVDFYGDFRIGGAFGIIGGFNRHLGWATTNNSPRYSQVYSLERHPTRDGHVVLDGEAVPIEERTVVADYRNPDGTTGTEREVTAWTPWGPVIHETSSHVYVLTDPRVGQFRRGQQMLRMMTAENMDEWLEVMRMRAHASSNFTYADADGNIGLYYNARIPDLPHESTGDTAAIARSSSDMWTEVAAWESLPLYVNPPGGYVQQANDTPDYINLNVALDRDTVAPNLPSPRLRLRSQLSFDLIHGDDRLSLEDVVERKHSPRMLAAERMLDDLLSALAATDPTPDLREAARILEEWDRTAKAESRGGVLFKAWFNTYLQVTDTLVYRQPWDAGHPASTPVGVGAPGRAAAAMRMAIEDLRAEGIALDTRWGDLHRVVRGSVDAPVSGCEGGLGCFRTLSFASMEDGRRAANRGDGWIFAVEFGDEPRGYSVLAYGQSRLEASPHYDDQAAMFARGEMKTILWSNADIQRGAIRRYRPGTR